MDGSIASPKTIVSDGFLGGSGVIGGDVLNASIVTPGVSLSKLNGTGTLTIKGNYTTFAPGVAQASTLGINVGGLSPSQTSLLNVGKSASIGGTLVVQSVNNFKFTLPGQAVIFLIANGGVSGQFAAVQGLSSLSGGALINVGVTYGSNIVGLQTTQNSVVSVLSGFSGLTTNDIHTERLLDSAARNPRAAGIFTVIDQASLSQLASEVQLIDPGSLAVLSNIGASISNTTLDGLEAQCAVILASSTGAPGPSGPDGKGGKEVMPPPANRWGTFATGSGDFQHVDDTSASRGYNFAAGGFTLGADYRFTDHFVAGIFGGYTNAGIDISNGRINVNAGKGGFYGTYFDGGFYVNSALEGGYSSYDNHRDGLGGTARRNTEGGDFGARLTPGYNWTKGGLTFGPTTRFQYTYQSADGFNESGSVAPMTIGSQHTESIVSGVGVKASYDGRSERL